MRLIGIALAATAVALASPASAQVAARWITLGTQGGPIPLKSRSQPANVLLTGDGAFVVDAGDGVVEQLAKAEVSLQEVKAVLLSHLHFDHTAGLFGILSLRWQTNIASPLAVYGPPGTRTLVDGILAAMAPAVRAGYAYPGEFKAPFEPGVTVVEIRDGASFDLGSTHVTAAKNTHYTFTPGSADDRAFESLAFRFDGPGRSIAYTGDTGPSQAVERLARGADLLVTEMIDFDRTVAEIHRVSPNMPVAAMTGITIHLRDHHLTPKQVGELARVAGVKSVVVTHLSAPAITEARASEYLREIGAAYPGPAVIANDLETF
uniref:MBL fold metallo-hydrolase n=1 Tax=Altererythrobacter segetis TaxID=1104773 RepID=UPI00140C46A9|nr:MBL fold metallo-hydrolase [Altererythrobacter segetis]